MADRFQHLLERVENAEAQARATQSVLLGIVHAMNRNPFFGHFVQRGLDIATDNATAFAMQAKGDASRPAMAVLQAVEHIRNTIQPVTDPWKEGGE